MSVLTILLAPQNRSTAVNYVGIDLHKKTIVLCVMNQDRKVIHRRTFACCDVAAITPF